LGGEFMNYENNFYIHVDAKGNFSRADGWYEDEDKGNEKRYTFTFDKLTESPVIAKFSYINKERIIFGCIPISTRNVECGMKYNIPSNIKSIIQNILHEAVIKAWSLGYRGNLSSQPFISPVAIRDGDPKKEECSFDSQEYLK
jgi:hypothetical protein